MKKLIAVVGLGAGLTAAPLMAAGTASASCVSLNGHGVVGKGPGIGGGCVSEPGSLSIGIGKDTQVHTDGVDDVGIAIGNPGKNDVPAYGVQPTQAYAGGGSGNFSRALGNGTNAGSTGTRNSAIAVGPGNNAYSFGGHPVEEDLSSRSNHSVVVGKGSNAYALGPADKHAAAFGNGVTSFGNGIR